jgi:hypothetical protein
MNETLLILARHKAERAVADMPDGELKTKAFEVILTQLLSQESSPSQRPAPARAATSSRKATPIPAKQNSAIKPSKVDRIVTLKESGFFKTPRSLAEVRDELRRRGWSFPLSSLSGPMQRLTQSEVLHRTAEKDVSARKAFKYVAK